MMAGSPIIADIYDGFKRFSAAKQCCWDLVILINFFEKVAFYD